jgi:hypothetical protein
MKTPNPGFEICAIQPSFTLSFQLRFWLSAEAPPRQIKIVCRADMHEAQGLMIRCRTPAENCHESRCLDTATQETLSM